MISVLCSSQSDPNNAPIPRTPNVANITEPFNIRRASRVLNIEGYQGPRDIAIGSKVLDQAVR